MHLKQINLFLLSSLMVLLPISGMAAQEDLDGPDYNSIESFSSSQSESSSKDQDDSFEEVYALIGDLSGGEANFEQFFNETVVNPSNKALALFSLYIIKASLLTYIAGVNAGSELHKETGSTVSVVISRGGLALMLTAAYLGHKGINILNDKAMKALEKAGLYFKKSDLIKEFFALEQKKATILKFKNIKQKDLDSFKNFVFKQKLAYQNAFDIADAHDSLEETKKFRAKYKLQLRLQQENLSFLHGKLRRDHKTPSQLSQSAHEQMKTEIKVTNKAISEIKANAVQNELFIQNAKERISRLPAPYNQRKLYSLELLNERTKAFAADLHISQEVLIQREAQAKENTLERNQRIKQIENKIAKLSDQTKKVVSSRTKKWVRSRLHTMRSVGLVLSHTFIPVAVLEGLIFTLGEEEGIALEVEGLDTDTFILNQEAIIKDIDAEISALLQ